MFCQLPRAEYTAHFPGKSHKHRCLHHFQICPFCSQLLIKHSLKRPFWPLPTPLSQLPPVRALPAEWLPSHPRGQPWPCQQGWVPVPSLNCHVPGSGWGRSLLHLPLAQPVVPVCFEMHGYGGRMKGRLQLYGNVMKSSSKIASGVVKKERGSEYC